MSDSDAIKHTNFIRQMIDDDIKAGKNQGRVATRFPPEPNGYLHIGHAKSIVLNFGIAADYKGSCNLRFDDTNPHKENIEFVNAIKKDVVWLGYDWKDGLYFSSDYFEKLHDYAVALIKKGKAYVCDLSAEQTREYRGTLKEPGKNSPYRDRSIDENLELFSGMRAGKFPDGTKLLRAKIDMASANMNMRDPAIYRIRHGVIHHQTGSEWCIYPMYDFTHCLSDAIEGITHSLCTLEFADHRPLYNWFLETLATEHRPEQTEFSRLTLEHTVTSKRKLTELVEDGLVEGWDDPRMPTIAGLKRRGYTAASIREFCLRIGVTKSDNLIEMAALEDCIRGDLNDNALRRMAVLRPLKIVITNYPEDQVEDLHSPNHPQKEELGKRILPFCRELYIDKNDFAEVPPPKFKRLVLGGEVRLRSAYVIRCEEIIKDGDGNPIELRCTYDVDTLGKKPEGRKVKGVVHWVSAKHAIPAEVRLYDRLFSHPAPDNSKDGKDFKDHINSDSLRTLTGCVIESNLLDAKPGDSFQFEREGYFTLDEAKTAQGHVIYNRTVTLRDSWAKINK